LICGLTRDAAAVLLRVFETTPGRGAAFSCGVFRTAGAAEAGGGRPATVVAARATADRGDVGSASPSWQKGTGTSRQTLSRWS